MRSESKQQMATRVDNPFSSERLIQTLLLDAEVSHIRHIKGARARGLSKLGISTVRDLIYHFPFRYDDFSAVVRIADARLGEKQSILGIVDEVTVKHPRKNLSLVEVTVLDGSGVLVATWFNQPWIAKSLKSGTQVLMLGRIEHHFGYKRLSSPLYTVLSSADDPRSSC